MLCRAAGRRMAPPIPVTEDTPPDMLAGSTDLSVVLPSGHSLKMSVERSTPMMDLLVQVTTANKMSPAGYIIQPLNEQGPLPYKPSTPIGALDAWTINVVPKQNVHCTSVKKPLKMLNQPFEQTFRLQVNTLLSSDILVQ
ncbi:protein-like 1 [Homalodisca vitripennis]|nr:protein-like 1 [Homalodisca vitripennis]